MHFVFPGSDLIYAHEGIPGLVSSYDALLNINGTAYLAYIKRFEWENNFFRGMKEKNFVEELVFSHEDIYIYKFTRNNVTVESTVASSSASSIDPILPNSSSASSIINPSIVSLVTPTTIPVAATSTTSAAVTDLAQQLLSLNDTQFNATLMSLLDAFPLPSTIAHNQTTITDQHMDSSSSSSSASSNSNTNQHIALTEAQKDVEQRMSIYILIPPFFLRLCGAAMYCALTSVLCTLVLLCIVL